MVVGSLIGGIAAYGATQFGQSLLASVAYSIFSSAATQIIGSLFKDRTRNIPPDRQSNYTQPVSPAVYAFGVTRLTPPMLSLIHI